MKKTILLLASTFSVCSLCVSAGEIPAGHLKMFKKIDADSSGSISKEEAGKAKYQFVLKKFANIDSNADGALSLEEFSAEIAKRNKAAKAKKAAAGQ